MSCCRCSSFSRCFIMFFSHFCFHLIDFGAHLVNVTYQHSKWNCVCRRLVCGLELWLTCGVHLRRAEQPCNNRRAHTDKHKLCTNSPKWWKPEWNTVGLLTPPSIPLTFRLSAHSKKTKKTIQTSLANEQLSEWAPGLSHRLNSVVVLSWFRRRRVRAQPRNRTHSWNCIPLRADSQACVKCVCRFCPDSCFFLFFASFFLRRLRKLLCKK